MSYQPVVNVLQNFEKTARGLREVPTHTNAPPPQQARRWYTMVASLKLPYGVVARKREKKSKAKRSLKIEIAYIGGTRRANKSMALVE